ncbi:hypothetical protein EJK55_1091 [Moraxella catarrhalis]|uniref:Uncharacterized protein n=1 Tax=Moraxella catarrhalis TaxID=480 RepID=A0A3S9QFV5_MORCA|nr:hypothetical protein MCR_0829 [Moraxella catarrhalis BBH18]AZQ87463.1 hypothetical protein EJK52_0875 [Moraxella catarrhalis]EGE11966.1 hypothetical protein E9K_08459 [Moraxella catarrhalis 103P14B1]EGE23437.1 hypothetical protein E9Y_09491 [Moraxella catarrhalis 101P30B1]EKF83453.1 hypothetical protein MCRH_0910 [Moraxella catarrhalis RH4]
MSIIKNIDHDNIAKPTNNFKSSQNFYEILRDLMPPINKISQA